MGQKLSNGQTQVTVTDSDGLGGLAIRLAQPPRVGGVANTARYRFEVYAETDEGDYLVGTFVTCPPGRQLTRAVAMANCPGARSWKLLISKVKDTSYDGAEVSCSVGRPSGEPGLQRVSERFKYYSGGAANNVAVLAGETVMGWTAASDAGGSSVVIDGGSTITVPPSGSMSGGGGGLIEGPLTITFGAGTISYLVEVAESA